MAHHVTSYATGIDKAIAIKVPKNAISIVSNIAKIKLFRFEKSGGNILLKISPKYFEESENNSIKLISKSIVTKISEAMQKIEDAAGSEIDNTEDYMLVCSALMAVTRNMYVETLGPADTIQMFEAVADSIMATEEMIKEFGRDYPKPTIH